MIVFDVGKVRRFDLSCPSQKFDSLLHQIATQFAAPDSKRASIQYELIKPFKNLGRYLKREQLAHSGS